MINKLLHRAVQLSREVKKDVAMVVEGGNVLETGVCGVVNHPLRHCCVNAVTQIANGQVKIINEDGIRPERPYLCTDYDVFVTREPCLICSMALLHSRIRRLFFLHLDPKSESGCPDDGSFTRMRLHVNTQLNHRFEVWKAINSS